MLSNMILASSKDAQNAYTLVRKLQKYFVDELDNLSDKIGERNLFQEVFWLRDDGLHGGGSRYEAHDNFLFNTGSVNVSQVHYDEDESKNLKSATALSTIIHPKNPNVPSIHIHISLTELRNNNIAWRLMADLNPAIINEEDKSQFTQSLKEISQSKFEEGFNQGNKYFYIPVLERTRGVSHFYLENYSSKIPKNDENFAFNFGKGIINTYINIITNAYKTRTSFSVQNIQSQLAYHTLYLFQVLTLDRGTTSGLMVHNQNDIGIMGSLPSFVDKNLLKSWIIKMPAPQDKLLENIVSCIPNNGVINNITKNELAQTVRKHYLLFPEALKMQASGNIIPNTVDNHIK
jgi:coproporphyrinogen III oxidase